jgi:hypothetical protein
VGDYCFTPNEQFFSHIMARTSFEEMMMMMSAFYYMLSWIL